MDCTEQQDVHWQAKNVFNEAAEEKSAGSHMSIRRLKAAPKVMRTTLGLRQNTQRDSSCPAAMNAARYSTAIISEKILPFMLELYHKGRPAIIKIYDHAIEYET